MAREPTLFEQRKKTVAYHYKQCQRHLIAADAAEASGRTRQAETLRYCALHHLHLMEQEQELIRLMQRLEVESAFEQVDVEGHVGAAVQPEAPIPVKAPRRRTTKTERRTAVVQLTMLEAA